MSTVNHKTSASNLRHDSKLVRVLTSFGMDEQGIEGFVIAFQPLIHDFLIGKIRQVMTEAEMQTYTAVATQHELSPLERLGMYEEAYVRKTGNDFSAAINEFYDAVAAKLETVPSTAEQLVNEVSDLPEAEAEVALDQKLSQQLDNS